MARDTGSPRRLREYKGALDAQRAGNLEWIIVSPKDPANPSGKDADVEGRYGFTFDYDAARDPWIRGREWYDWDHGCDFSHMQQMDATGRRFRGHHSPFVLETILKAAERAQSGKAGVDASGTAAPRTVPAEAERPFKN